MDKEKVIELVKRSKVDEREKQINSRGYQISGAAMAIAMLIIMILRSSKGDLFSQDLLFIMMIQVSTVSLYTYVKLKNTLYLITFVIGGLAAILTLINVLTEYGYIL